MIQSGACLFLLCMHHSQKNEVSFLETYSDMDLEGTRVICLLQIERGVIDCVKEKGLSYHIWNKS